jgi:hypothetical protein
VISAWALFNDNPTEYAWEGGEYGMAQDQLTLDWRDAAKDAAVGKFYVAQATTAGQIEDILDELQGLSQIKLVGTNRIVKTAFANSEGAVARDASAPYADDKVHAQIIYRTTNPAEFVRVSVYGPKADMAVMNDNKIDIDNVMFDALHALAALHIVSNSGSAVTVPMSGKLIFG